MGLSPGNIRHEGTSQHTYNGTRGTQSNHVFDGTQLGDQRGTQISIAQPSFESVQEMKIISVNNSAEYGGVATVVLTSRSGTNELHGSGFYQYNSGSLNARNFYQASSPWRVLNEFGGRIGGPVRLPGYNGHNRTFFFTAYEGNRDHTQRIYNASVPTLALRSGDFSRIPIVVRDPTNNLPFTAVSHQSHIHQGAGEVLSGSEFRFAGSASAECARPAYERPLMEPPRRKARPSVQ
jgi:hypothetical protein